ncbi:ERC protein 2-like [Chenopodium quinoa]|uniref:ERC protein 2-like n=1 Tax=Chenopodium quinoa TaxID=63459 RepID=UPI000B777C2C|nr:ERC protein 2-like [Chenopodium quinoa]
MSVNSMKQSFISTIIHSLRSSFQDSEFKEAERELMAREENIRREKGEVIANLRDKCGAFESELGEMKTEKIMWEEERRRLGREAEVNDEKLKDLARELSNARDNLEKGARRYDGLLEKLRVCEVEKKGLAKESGKLRDENEGLKRNLRDKEDEIEEIDRKNGIHLKELEEKDWRIGLLMVEKSKLGTLLEEVKVGRDERIREMRVDNERLQKRILELEEEKEKAVLEKEKAVLEKEKAVFEDEAKEVEGLRMKISGLEEERARLEKEKAQLEKQKAVFEDEAKEVEGLRMRILGLEKEKARLEDEVKEVEGLQMRILGLEEEKDRLNASCEEIRRNEARRIEEVKEVLEREKLESLREKDEIIQELNKEKEDLVIEQKNLTAKMEKAENWLSKLEGDITKMMCLDLKRDATFISSQCGRILSVIGKALDSEGIGLTCNAQEADSAFVYKSNEPKGFLKSDDAVKRTLDFEAEIVKENGASGIKETTVNSIIIVDSDDDDEYPLRVSGVKRKYVHPENLREQCDSSNDDSLNQKHMKKLERGSYGSVKPVLSTPSTAGDGHKFNVQQRQTLSVIRKCEEKLVRDIGEPRFDGFVDNGGKEDEYGNSNFENNKAHSSCPPQLEKYMATCRQRKENKKLEVAADMVCAFDEDPDFCAKAVCALYRQFKSSMKGSICASSKGFEKCDADRGISLAKFLIDGDLKGKMKRSVDELQQHDQSGLDDCCRLAKKNAKQLIDIYKKGEDPLFSPLSTDLKYK